MVKRHVVGAHYGTRGWLAQRMTALYMALYTLVFLILLAAMRPAHLVAWREIFAHQGMKLATFLFFITLFVHAWVGMRDILMDYVKPTGVRLSLQMLVLALLAAYASWSVQILWSV